MCCTTLIFSSNLLNFVDVFQLTDIVVFVYSAYLIISYRPVIGRRQTLTIGRSAHFSLQ